jgi:hypothetical protein
MPGKRTHRERTVSRKTTAASRTPARTRSLLSMWGFQAKVVAEAAGRRVGYILSLRIHGVAEACFEERVAGLREVPYSTEDGVPGFEAGVDKETEIARHIVIKAEDGCELPELQFGIELDFIDGEPYGYKFRAPCRVRNERYVTTVLPHPDPVKRWLTFLRNHE